MPFPFEPNRRQVVQGLAAGAATSCIPWAVRAQQSADPKFLIVLAAGGGASIIDAMLAIRESESNQGAAINTFPDGQVTDIGGSPFRAVDLEIEGLGPIPHRGQSNQSAFVDTYKDQMMVTTCTGTSVNHVVAQKRSLTGNDAWSGRTLQEAVAAHYGADFPIPNVNMATGGYVEPGIDPALPSYARAEVVVDAIRWFAGLHGSKGIDGAPAPSLIEKARRLRDEQFDPNSVFGRTFKNSAALRTWRARRAKVREYEAADLVRKANPFPDMVDLGSGRTLADFGLFSNAEDVVRLSQVFPNLGFDPLEQQAALAYLLIKNRISVTVTLGDSAAPVIPPPNLITPQRIVDSPPLAFDFSHTNHRDAQAVMWHRLLNVSHRLILLLQNVEFGGGQSFWDRSMLYVATDFGRTRVRPAGSPDFGSGHHLNNGNLFVSPLVNGGTIMGGVNPHTGLTYGFDPQTGAPEGPDNPEAGDNPGRQMAEAEIYAGALQALGVDTTGSTLPSVPAMSAR